MDSSKLKQFADGNFKFDKNGSKFFKQVENTVGKGEIMSNFYFSHSVFKRGLLPTFKNQGLFWKELMYGSVAFWCSCNSFQLRLMMKSHAFVRENFPKVIAFSSEGNLVSFW